MGRVRKLILVTAQHHPLHKYFVDLTERVAGELGIDKEVRYEDYVFLIEHGETDELGMTWLPQLLAEMDDGKIVLLMSKAPLDDSLRPDIEKGLKEVHSKIKSLEGG